MAVPAGDLRAETAGLLRRAGIEATEYEAGSRLYHFRLQSPEMRLRVFRDPDVPIQVALGHYDLGICAGAWLQESHARFPNDDLVPLRPLGYGVMRVYAAVHAAANDGIGRGPVRIAAEYPNLAELFALSARLGNYRILPLHGAAEAYPPEDADIAVVGAKGEADLAALGLRAVHCIYAGGAWLVANRRSLASRDLSPVLGPIVFAAAPYAAEHGLNLAPRALHRRLSAPARPERDVVRLALPDGHQQPHAYASLRDAGLAFEGYGEREWIRRPSSSIAGLEVKVIRPQDMPQQVALGNFDLAITGRDWLADHLYAFPSSPVAEAVDLGRSRYSLAAVVPEDLPAEAIDGALALWRGREVRIASEYVNTADHYARLRRIPRYRVIPIHGASEGFVPDDADILIEGSETGTTLRANALKSIDNFFVSTSCVIRSTNPISGPRARLIDDIVARLARGAVAEAPRSR